MQSKLKPLNQQLSASFPHIVPHYLCLEDILQSKFKCNGQFAFRYIFSLKILSGEAQVLPVNSLHWFVWYGLGGTMIYLCRSVSVKKEFYQLGLHWWLSLGFMNLVVQIKMQKLDLKVNIKDQMTQLTCRTTMLFLDGFCFERSKSPFKFILAACWEWYCFIRII